MRTMANAKYLIRFLNRISNTNAVFGSCSKRLLAENMILLRGKGSYDGRVQAVLHRNDHRIRDPLSCACKVSSRRRVELLPRLENAIRRNRMRSDHQLAGAFAGLRDRHDFALFGIL